MRTFVALVFHYSLNGLLADEGTDYYRFCFELLDEHGGADDDDATLEFLRTADVHLMGRRAYESMSNSLPTSDHPWAEILTSGRKVVVSRTLSDPRWANTEVISDEAPADIEALHSGGDGHVIVWGGVGLWQSLMRRDLIDEFRIGLHPYVTNEGSRLFDDVPSGYRLDLTSSTPLRNGVVELEYRRHR